MGVGLDNDADAIGRGSIPSGGAGTLTDGGFAGFFAGVWVYRPSSGNAYGTTSDGYIIQGLASAREIKLGFDNTFGGGTPSDPLLQVIFNSGGGTGASQTFAGANLLDEWVFYFLCADATNQYAGYIRYADLGVTITDSITRANDNAGSQYINALVFGNNAATGTVVMGHYAYGRARYGNHDLTDVMALAQSSAPDAGDWGFWPFADNADVGDDSGNSRDMTFAGTLTSESDPVLSSGATQDQEGFRFGADDDTESAHGWIDAQDVNITRPLDETILLRLLVDAVDDPASGAYSLRVQKNGSGGYTDVPTVASVTPTLSYGAAGAFAYSGTNPAPAYPTGITADSELVLIVGQKPSSANGGTVTTPTGWTLQASLTGGNDGNTGGYSSTLGADTGNTNIYVYTKDVVTGSETGSLTVTTGTNNVAWARIIRLQKSVPGTVSWAAATGKDTSAGSVSIATGALDLAAGDYLIGGMVIPTDVTTPSQFSAHALSQGGTTFGTVTEIGEADSTTNNDIGGYLIEAPVSSGSGTGAVTMTATAGGTTTNVRGPGFLLRARPVAVPNELYIATSANITAGGEATTARLTAPAGKSTSDFVTGRRWDDENGSDSLDIGADEYTELEWTLRAQSPAANGDYFDFRVYVGASALDSYALTPRWTIGSGAIVLEAVLGGTGAIVADLSTAIRLASALAGAGSVTPALSTQIRLAAALQGSGTLAGALTSQITLATHLQGAGTLVAALLTEIRAAAALNGAGTLAAALSTAIGCASTLTGAGTLAASLEAGSGFAAALPGTGTLTPALTSAITLAAQLQAVATLAGDLDTAIRFAAALAAAGTLAAALDTQIRLATALAGTGSVSAAITTAITLAAALQGAATLAAQLSTSITLASTWAGTGSLAADLAAGSGFAAQLAGAGTFTPDLLTAVRLAAALPGAGTLAAAVTSEIQLAATLPGVGTIAPNLQTGSGLATALAGSGALAGDLATAIRLAAVVQGTGTLVAAALTQIRLAAALTGAGTLGPGLTTAIELRAAASGAATLAAALETQIGLAAALAGSAAVMGSLDTEIRLAAALDGVGTLSANLISFYIRLLSIASEGLRVSRVDGEAFTRADVAGERLDLSRVTDDTLTRADVAGERLALAHVADETIAPS